MKKFKTVRQEVENMLCSAESMSNRRARILLSVSKGQNKYSGILGELRRHDSRLGITKIKNDITALSKKALILVLKEENISDTMIITKLGANILAQIEVNFPEKVFSKCELSLSQNTQRTMMETSV